MSGMEQPKPIPRRPRVQRAVSPNPSHESQPPHGSHPPHGLPPSTRPGVVVEAVAPISGNNRDPKGMLKWLIGNQLQFQGDVVKEIQLTDDYLRAYIEFHQPEVIPQLLSAAANLQDPISEQPLSLQQIDLNTIWPPCVLIKGFPHFVDETMLWSHFEQIANGQHVRSVWIAEDKQNAMVTFDDPRAAFDVVSRPMELFGSHLCLDLGYCGPKPSDHSQAQLHPQENSTPALCVQGLPESMMSNQHALSEALKHFIRQTTEFDIASCTIVNGNGYLTFTSPSAIQAIACSPPTASFIAGSVLHFSVASLPLESPYQGDSHLQVPPVHPKQAWGDPTAQNGGQLPGNTSPQPQRSQTGGQLPGSESPQAPRSQTGEQLPGSTSPQALRPQTAPVGQVNRLPLVPTRRRLVSDNISIAGNQNPPYSGGQNQRSIYPQQQNPQSSYGGPMSHSASSPGNLWGGQQGYIQQPTSRRVYPPVSQHVQSSNQWGHAPVQGYGRGLQPSDVHHSRPIGQQDAYPPQSDVILEAPMQPGLHQSFQINNLPNEAKNKMVLSYYFKGITKTQAPAKVDLYGNSAVVTFERPMGLEQLRMLVKQDPLEGAELLIMPLEPSDQVFVSGLTEGIPDMGLKYALGAQTVKRLSPSQAIVNLRSAQSAQQMASQSQIEFEGVQLSVKEYYPFMDPDETDSPQKGSQLPAKTVQQYQAAKRQQLTKEQHFYLQRTLSELNEKLQPLKACVEIEQDGLGYCLITSPLEGSSAIDKWEDKVVSKQKEHLEGLSIEKITFPKEARADVQDIIFDHRDRGSIMIVEKTKEFITIAGQREIIAGISEETVEISQTFLMETHSIELPRKRVKFLAKFCQKEFLELKADVEDVQFNPDAGVIVVTGNPKGRSNVGKVIEQANAATEKDLILSQSAYRLLSTQRGTKKLSEVFSATPGLSAQLVYDLEQFQDPSDGTNKYQICLLSKDPDVDLKGAKNVIKLYIHEVAFQTSPAKIRVCTSKEWREFVSKLQDEHFVAITDQEATNTIVVTGEKILCADVVDKVRKFLEKHTNIEERLTVSQSEWKVINQNFSKEVSGVTEQAKLRHVKVEWPKAPSQASSLPVVISGEPGVVDDIKVMVQAVKNKVCTKEDRIAGVAAVVHVLKSMEDRIRLLEADEKVQIDVNLESADDEGTTGAAQAVAGEVPRQVCSSTSPGGSRVSIYTGDLTQTAPVGVIVSFVSPEPNPQVGHLKHLLESGGPEATDDFKRKISQFIDLKPGSAFKTRYGRLKCSQLIHCVLPPWKTKEKNTEYYLEESLDRVIKDASPSGSILITPLTLAPLQYPVHLFVKQVLDSVTNQAINASNLQVSVYVEDLHDAKEFQNAFQARNFQLHTRVPVSSPLLGPKKPQPSSAPSGASAKTVSSNLGSFIQVVNGDLLQQQAEVYINSSNTNLNLKQGQLSKLLLNACGESLQKECTEYAPLKPGHVAVTDAKNLKCNHIFHIALPDYKTTNSERLFRETIKQILRIAKSMSISSIAIPSLGVANLGYPANVSARILFQEVVAFHAQYPSSIQKFIFVIYEKNVFQVFNKEFTDQMSGESKPEASVPATAAAMAPSAAAASPHLAGSTLLTINQGNIADEKTDLIVNTTTEDMELNKSAVSKAIAERAGGELQKACRQLCDNGMKLDHGNIAMTPAFGKLHCKKIIHAHVPHRGSMPRSSTQYYQIIEKIVADCLEKAENCGMHSVSFPAFGLGGGGYSVDQVADPMLKAFQKFGQAHPKAVRSIRVVIYDPELYKKFYEHYCKFFGRSSVDSPSAPQSILSRVFGGARKPKNDGQELQAATRGPAVHHLATPPLWALSHSVQNATIVFQIFAASDQQCEKIAKTLRSLISDKSTTKEIKEDSIEHLIEDDMKDILQVGDRLGVQVKILSKIKEIHISGETAKVMEANAEIQKILSDIERALMELKTFEWLSEDEDSGVFEPYSEEASVRLERASYKHLKLIELIIDGVAVIVDLQYFHESNKATGKRRKIKREKKAASVEFPDTWESVRGAAGVKRETLQKFEVPEGSPEYDDTVRGFKESLEKYNIKYTIEKVERIENKQEYSKHTAVQQSVTMKHRKPAHVKRLYHGSKLDSLEKISVQGFNRNFAADAHAAYYGKGVYFALEAAYSANDKYSVADSAGLQYMFVCRVVVGEYTQGKQDMKVAPQLASGSNEVYDTLVDNKANPTIFVAMSDAQAYPEYLITFRKP